MCVFCKAFFRKCYICMNKQSSYPKSANWRIVIPNLVQYKDASRQELMQLKYVVLQRLKNRPQDERSSIKSQFDRGLRYYTIALERHANGVPHLDILLHYDKAIRRKLTDYDFLLRHGNVSTYRKLNSAIIEYGKKEDKEALSSFPDESDQILEFQIFKSDPYRYLELQMLEDPLHFNIQQYVRVHDLYQYINSWTSIKSKLKDSQLAAANLILKNRPDFKPITRQLVQQRLSPQQLLVYDSWPGYAVIVDYLNQIPTLGGLRQMKTKNLLITGPVSIGKTSLFHNPNHKPDRACVEDFCAVYPMGMSTWFPHYRSGVYRMILWNQAKLTSYSYTTILKLLEGSFLDLPTKGGVAPKRDNPLIVMTSNMTLDQMIRQKFNNNPQYLEMARKTMAVRVENVCVPEGHDLFLLQKLLTPR